MDFQTYAAKYHFEHLDDQQKMAVQTVNGPVLLLAVPGSGKTTTLVARLGYLIYGVGVDPRRILTMTYTVAATKEMRERFSKRFGPNDADKFECRTINGLCCKIIDAYAKRGHQPHRLIQEQEQSAILRTAWAQICTSFPTEQEIRSAKIYFSNVKNRMLRDKEQMKALAKCFDADESVIDLPNLYRRYQDLLVSNRLMDYDDQMVYALAILRKEPEILNLFQNMYRYICVDEAQDTSKIQHAVIYMLAQKQKNLFMVGDEDQSIYGFRAAEPKELLEFEKRWPGAKVLFIETNYRSSPEIVDAAARIIRMNKERRDKKMRAVQKSGDKPSAIPCQSRAKQFEMLVRRADKAAQDGEELAILYRNNETALPLVDQLEKYHIPYRAKAVDTLFFTCKEYLDIKAFFALAENNSDAEAFMRIYSKINGLYLTRQKATMIAESGSNVFGQLRQSGIPSWKMAEIERAFRIIRASDTLQGIREIRYTLGYEKWLERQGNNTFRLSILELLAKDDRAPADFIRHMEGPGGLKDTIVKGKAGKKGCVLSTIHSSKGLEYDHVILADVADKIFPSTDAIQEEKDGGPAPAMEEERRLFYVGVTRAKRKLEIVTFENGESRFAQALLGTPNKPASTVAAPAGTAAPAWRQTVGITPDTANQTAPAFSVNERVRHVVYGAGIVINANRDRVTVLFDKNGVTKSFLPSFVVESGLMEKE